MNKINYGGSAFPRPSGSTGPCDSPQYNYAQQGMSLRDYFAAKAMQQYCSIAGLSDEQIATFAYTTADAMLSARNKAHD